MTEKRQTMSRTSGGIRAMFVAALFVPAISLPAAAFTVCLSDGSVTCLSVTPDQAQIARDDRMINTGQHRTTGSYLNVDEAKRTKGAWPLGKPSLQNCRWCLEPDRLNAARLNQLP